MVYADIHQLHQYITAVGLLINVQTLFMAASGAIYKCQLIWLHKNTKEIVLHKFYLAFFTVVLLHSESNHGAKLM